jgi:hypothetical protein
MYFKHITKLASIVCIAATIFSQISLGFVQTNAAEAPKFNTPTTTETSNNADTSKVPTTDELLETTDNGAVDNTLLIKVKKFANEKTVSNDLEEKLVTKFGMNGDLYEGTEDGNDSFAIQFDSKDKLKQALVEAKNRDDVEIAQPNYKYKKQYIPSNDTEWTNAWYLKDQANSTYTQSGWDAVGAKAGVTCGETVAGKRCGGEQTVKIAVIDSGVNTTLADFTGANIDTTNQMRFYNNPGGTACPSGEAYTPANGLVIGWSFCQKIGTGATQQYDEDGHGTAVSSIIMAQDNATGSVGIAHNTTLLPIALHSDTFNTFFISEAVRYAQARGAKVINLSLGTPYYDSYLEAAINDVTAQGVVVVAASGNCAVFSVTSCDWDGSGTQNQPEEANNAIMYPAGFTNVIAVGASNTNGTRSCYSNFGAHLDVVAPVGDAGTSCGGTVTPSGVRIACGVVGGSCSGIGVYRGGAGTSYATPQVAAAVGLMKSADATLNFGQVQSLFASGNLTDLGATGRDDSFGNGLLNVNNLLQVVAANYVPTHYFTWSDNTNGQQTYIMVSNPSANPLKVKLTAKGNSETKYKTISAGGILIERFLAFRGGPIEISTENGVNPSVSQRSLIQFNGVQTFSEIQGIKTSSITNKYFYTWHDTLNTENLVYYLTYNPSTNQTANISIKIGGIVRGTYSILPGQLITPEFKNLKGGPIEISSDINIISSQRVVYNNSFNEIGGIGQNTLTNKYFYTWHDTLGNNVAVPLVGNPSTSQAANVSIKIAGISKGTYLIPPGQIITPEYFNLKGGPIEINSDINVYTTQRVLFNSNNKITFNELSGIKANQLTNNYRYNWHHMLGADVSIPLIGNPSTTQSANITLKIRGITKGTYTIAPNTTITPEVFNLVDGPIEIISDINIYTTQRVLFDNSFNEFEGIS